MTGDQECADKETPVEKNEMPPTAPNMFPFSSSHYQPLHQEPEELKALQSDRFVQPEEQRPHWWDKLLLIIAFANFILAAATMLTAQRWHEPYLNLATLPRPNPYIGLD
ncbi:hypothetical protein C8J57DRAFT_1726307 [Mycena rebaudengoi]|nr:hypothetical protein C8J57DRAFT_1726307 [Mycena rebaudengoi]